MAHHDRVGHSRDIGLRPEGEVEHPGGLIAEHQADRHQGEGAPIGDAGQRVAEGLTHVTSQVIPSEVPLAGRDVKSLSRGSTPRYSTLGQRQS